VLIAGWWGFVAGSSLLLGAVLAWARPWSTRVVGLVMAFGSGVLISSVAFELVEDALDQGGGTPVTLGMAGGALTYFVGDSIVSGRSAFRRKRSTRRPQPEGADGNPMAIVLGAVLDGIPESAAIGISLLAGGKVGGSFVAAVFLSNVPESLSASAGLAKTGYPWRRIMRIWLAVTVVSAVSAAAGYGLLDGAGPGPLAALSAYAAGAVLTMVASTMLPEAHEDGGPTSGLVTSAGFLIAVLIGSLAQAA
jgi:zinc transporter, ZIP family